MLTALLLKCDRQKGLPTYYAYQSSKNGALVSSDTERLSIEALLMAWPEHVANEISVRAQTLQFLDQRFAGKEEYLCNGRDEKANTNFGGIYDKRNGPYSTEGVYPDDTKCKQWLNSAGCLLENGNEVLKFSHFVENVLNNNIDFNAETQVYTNFIEFAVEQSNVDKEKKEKDRMKKKRKNANGQEVDEDYVDEEGEDDNRKKKKQKKKKQRGGHSHDKEMKKMMDFICEEAVDCAQPFGKGTLTQTANTFQQLLKVGAVTKVEINKEVLAALYKSSDGKPCVVEGLEGECTSMLEGFTRGALKRQADAKQQKKNTAAVTGITNKLKKQRTDAAKKCSELDSAGTEDKSLDETESEDDNNVDSKRKGKQRKVIRGDEHNTDTEKKDDDDDVSPTGGGRGENSQGNSLSVSIANNTVNATMNFQSNNGGSAKGTGEGDSSERAVGISDVDDFVGDNDDDDDDEFRNGIDDDEFKNGIEEWVKDDSIVRGSFECG